MPCSPREPEIEVWWALGARSTFHTFVERFPLASPAGKVQPCGRAHPADNLGKSRYYPQETAPSLEGDLLGDIGLDTAFTVTDPRLSGAA